MKKKHPSLPVLCDKEGKIYSAFSGKERKPNTTKHGYFQISTGGSSFLAHRLVAQTWIPNPKNKPKINHKNGIKKDNRVSNLEWVTQRENILHARDVLGVKYSVPGLNHPSSIFESSHEIILINLFNKGFKLGEISEIMGFSKPTIDRHMKRIRNEQSKNSLPLRQATYNGRGKKPI